MCVFKGVLLEYVLKQIHIYILIYNNMQNHLICEISLFRQTKIYVVYLISTDGDHVRNRHLTVKVKKRKTFEKIIHNLFISMFQQDEKHLRLVEVFIFTV